LGRRHNAIHNAQPQRFGGIDHVAGVKHFSRFRRAHEFGQEKTSRRNPETIRPWAKFWPNVASSEAYPNVRGQRDVHRRRPPPRHAQPQSPAAAWCGFVAPRACPRAQNRIEPTKIVLPAARADHA